MIRKIISLHVFAALICVVAAAVANADCGLCGGNCADGACQAQKSGGLLSRLSLFGGSKSCTGGGCDSPSCTTCAAPAAPPVVVAPAPAPAPCLGGCKTGCAGGGCQTGGCGAGCGGDLLAKLHGAFAPVDDGICRTCENIWDDYCAEKRNCLPGPKYPFQNHHGCNLCGAAGGCGCANGNGVGIYGGLTGCGACGASPCKCGTHNLMSNLFAKKGCDKEGCDSPSCDGGCAASAAVSYAPPVVHSTPVHQTPVQQAYSYSAPAYTASEPANFYSNDSYSTPAPSEPVIEAETTIAPTPVDSMPPIPPSPSDLPAITDQSSTTGAFDWLQRALQLN